MKPLSNQFRLDGFDFAVLQRIGEVAVLSKHKQGHTRGSYEVVIIQRHPQQTIQDQHYPERESLPRAKAWGTLGWTHTDLPAAMARFRHLVTNRPKCLSHPTPFPADASQARFPVSAPRGGPGFS